MLPLKRGGPRVASAHTRPKSTGVILIALEAFQISASLHPLISDTTGRDLIQQVCISDMSHGVVTQGPEQRLLVSRPDPDQTIGVDENPAGRRHFRIKDDI